jgi:hypothetical protein
MNNLTNEFSSMSQYDLDHMNFFSGFTLPSQFKSQIASLQSQLPGVLQNFTNNYVLNYANPGNQEYEQSYTNAKNMLNNLSSQLFTTSNEIQYNTEEINKKLIEIDALVRKEKTEQKQLKKKLGIVESNMNASEELIMDFQEMYDSEYLRNWGLFLSVLVALFCLSKIYDLSGFIIICIFIIDLLLIVLFVISKIYKLSIYIVIFVLIIIVMSVLLAITLINNVYKQNANNPLSNSK